MYVWEVNDFSRVTGRSVRASKEMPPQNIIESPRKANWGIIRGYNGLSPGLLQIKLCSLDNFKPTLTSSVHKTLFQSFKSQFTCSRANSSLAYLWALVKWEPFARCFSFNPDSMSLLLTVLEEIVTYRTFFHHLIFYLISSKKPVSQICSRIKRTSTWFVDLGRPCSDRLVWQPVSLNHWKHRLMVVWTPNLRAISRLEYPSSNQVTILTLSYSLKLLAGDI